MYLHRLRGADIRYHQAVVKGGDSVLEGWEFGIVSTDPFVVLIPTLVGFSYALPVMAALAIILVIMWLLKIVPGS